MVDFDNADTDVLMEFDYISGMGNATIGHLGDMYKTILMDPDVDKGTKVSNVGDDARQFHAFNEVVDGIDARIELKLFNLLARVATRFLQFLEDIGEGRDAYLVSHVALDVDGLALLLIIDQVDNGTILILGHLLYNVVALRMDSRVVERILGTGDAEETCTLLEGSWSETRHHLELGT